MGRIHRSDEFHRARATLAGAISRQADPAEVRRLREAFERARAEDDVRRAVAAAPRLTDADRAALIGIVLGVEATAATATHEAAS